MSKKKAQTETTTAEYLLGESWFEDDIRDVLDEAHREVIEDTSEHVTDYTQID